jgi:hypothetical protein
MAEETPVPAGNPEQTSAEKPEQTSAEKPDGRRKAKKAEVGVFVAVGNDYYNPFTKQTFQRGCDTEALLDGWVQAQLDAGYMTQVG